MGARHGTRMTTSPLGALANEGGVALVVALWILVCLAVLGASANVLSRTDVGISRNFRNDATAFYIAEAGLQRALGKINAENFWVANLADPTGDAFPGDNAFGAGSYTVQVFADDPVPQAIRVRSTGHVDGSNAASTVEAVLTPAPFEAMSYASFTCGNALFSSSAPTDITGNVYSSGHLNMGSAGGNVTVVGNAYAMGNVTLAGASRVMGDAFANGNLSLNSVAAPNVTGDGTAGGGSGGVGGVGGTLTTGATPVPVADECTPAQLAASAVAQEDIQGYRDNADNTVGALTINAGDVFPYTGILHVTGNLKVNGDATFAGDVVIVADGNVSIDAGLTSNPPGSKLLLLMESGNLQVKNGADVTIDGAIQLGAASQDGTAISGGNLIVGNGANIDVTGSLLTLNGNSGSTNAGSLTVTYAPYDDASLKKRYGMSRWRRL